MIVKQMEMVTEYKLFCMTDFIATQRCETWTWVEIICDKEIYLDKVLAKVHSFFKYLNNNSDSPFFGRIDYYDIFVEYNKSNQGFTVNVIIPKMEGVMLKTFGELCAMKFNESKVAVRLGGDFIGGVFNAYSNLTLDYLKWDVKVSPKRKEQDESVGERKRSWVDMKSVASQN